MDQTSKLEAYLAHSIDDEFPGLRDPLFPSAVVEIHSVDTWFDPPSKRWRSPRSHPLIQIYKSESFTIRIRDGKDSIFNGGVWDSPPLDRRKPEVIEPGSVLDEILEEYSDEMRAVVEKAMDGIPDPGEAIGPVRQDELVLVLQRALQGDGYAWIAQGIDSGDWSRNRFLATGMMKLVLLHIVIMGIVEIGLKIPGFYRRFRGHNNSTY